MNPLISVVIPTYNHANFLGRALHSVLSQTYPHYEVLVVDNNSQDHTYEVINSFRDARIRTIKIENNGVIAASRNLGISEARGEWIAFLDSDDYWYPEKLKKMLSLVQFDGEADVLSHDELKVDVGTGARKILRYGPYEDNFYKALLMGGNRLSTSATMIRRKFLTLHKLSFDENTEYITVEDYDLWLNLARLGAKFKFLKEVHGEYIIHGNNNSSQLLRHWGAVEAVLRNHVFNLQQFHRPPERLWGLLSSRLSLLKAQQFFIGGEFIAGTKLVFKVFMRSPSGVIFYFFMRTKRFMMRKFP
jgi:glycosyltransferase involved in cell wall biosynthesis